MKKMSLKQILLFMTILGLTACAESTPAPRPEPMPTPTLIVITSPPPLPEPTFEKNGSVETDVTYCTPEGLPQKMDVFYPASGGPWPVLFYVHGGGWRAGDKSEGIAWQSMTERGFLVVSINYRLAAEAIKFPAMIEDVKCAVRYLRAHASQYNLDAEHIGAVGVSAGGHLVDLLGLADESAGWDTGEYREQSSRVQAVVTLAGVSDLTLKRGATESAAAMIYYAFDIVPGSALDPVLRAASPVTYVTPDDPPFLIIHGDQDNVVPVEQSIVLEEQLKKAGVPAELIIVGNGTHGIAGENISPTLEAIMNRISAFLDEQLK